MLMGDPHIPHQIHRVAKIGVPAIAVVGVVVSYVLSTVVMDQVPDAVLAGVAVGLAALVAMAVYGRRAVLAEIRADRTAALFAAAGGIACFWLAPLVVLTQRASDAPSGAVVLFHTTTLWGLIAASSWWVRRGIQATHLAAAGALVATAGAAGLLANWERPSSFSPFIKYLQPELLMLVAGLIFVAGSYALVTASRSLRPGALLTVSLVAAGIVGGSFAAPALLAAAPTLQRLSTELVLLGIAVYAMAWGWTQSVLSVGVGRAAAVLLVAPAATTLLSEVERATGVHGPDPIQWGGAMPATVLCGAGAVLVWLAGTGGRRAEYRPRLLTAAWAVAAMAAVTAAVGLALPALKARSVGTLPTYFEAEWVMRGFQSAAGWLPFAGALVVFSAAVLVPRGSGVYPTIAASFVGFLTAWAYRPLLSTPLHTWQNWIPSDVQQTYGTEYARFSVVPIASPVSIAAVVLTALAAALLLLSIIRIAPAEDLT